MRTAIVNDKHTTRITAIAVAVALVAASSVLAVLVVNTFVTPDPGIAACQMMQNDLRSGTTPDEVRSNQELALLRRSDNEQLRIAANKLGAADMTSTFEGVGPLYTGCAQVGYPLTPASH
jgi:hypothetical protein